ncbi:MAG: hypothetical protein K8S25_07585 [Alphaproteobacteria bacterium]|nr:hypothetical protein [Alphaproteobacteria bacterium]
MAQSQQVPRWLHAVAALDAIVGAVLIVAGAYLLDPAPPDLGFYLEGGRYAFAGGFLIYAGLVLAYAAIFGFTSPGDSVVAQLVFTVFGTLGRFSSGAILLVLSLRALMFEPIVGAIALLAVPGALTLLSLEFAAIAKARVTEEANLPPVTPDTGKATRFEFGPHLWQPAILVLTRGAGVFLLLCALYAYVLLDALLIRDRPIDLGYAAGVIFSRLLPIFLLLQAAIIGFIVIAAIAPALRNRLRRRKLPDKERDLTIAEIAFVNDYASQIQEHVARHDLIELAKRVSGLSLWSTLILVGLGLVLLLNGEHMLASIYAPAGAQWQLYLTESRELSAAIPLLLLTLLGLPGAVWQLLSRRAAEAGGAAKLKTNGKAGELEAELVKHVRERRLIPDAAPSAADTLRSFGLATSILTLGLILALWSGVSWWWPHERARDTLYTDHGIETGEFWSMKRTTVPYAAVLTVRLQCEIYENDDTRIGFTIVLPGGMERNLVSLSTLNLHLDDALRVDENLRKANAKFIFSRPDSVLTSDVEAVDRECVLKLADADEERRAKLEQLFHLDEWFERRWQQRTGQRAVASP